ncbi:FecR family protein [Prosthecobacter fusiformis]|uniref:FecR family protein n=1 Tax=Prosthecobacter fusiformis TaxID=48464 RepID=A0A4R7SSJ7_9BACT|nr:LamG-like jellyroll fold domain-containing protein [Prosthecobacter fusiformis]TDU81158.1 FecR family protein [Prosthecobacter fusiformis]
MNLKSLIHARLDGEITPEQLAQLEELLREDWQARRLYLELADLHARLLQQPQIAAGRLPKKVVSVSSQTWKSFLPALAAAAVIALAFTLWPHDSPLPEATSNGVAMLSQTMDAEFEQNSMRSGDTLMPGRIKLTKGLAQIEFFSGATALVEGAAEIEVISAWEARCVSGRVRVHVPPAAKGFLMHAPGMKLEDLGTEFALNVKNDSSAVHVFEGEVIAHTNLAPTSLTQGMTLGNTTDDFLRINELQGLVKERQAHRFADWQAWSARTEKDPRLIAYYTFKHRPEDQWDRMVNNLAQPPQEQRHGGAVGARWTQGRWPEKEALEFKRPGDRVRMNLDGTYAAITLACWVKVDSVDKKYNSLLLTDGYDNGEPHWQIYEDGSLMFSIMYRPASAPKGGKPNQIYHSNPVFTADSLGRWHHLAVTYNNQSGQVIQYFDGQEVSREVSALHQPGRDISLGPCEIGNWGLPTAGHQFPIRNLNGAIDEFAIYSAVLSAEEVKAMFETGKVE